MQRREGFSFTPFKFSSPLLVVSTGSYGITDSFRQFSDWTRTDPNKKYLDGLNPQEIQRYWQVMNGQVTHDQAGHPTVGWCTNKGAQIRETMTNPQSPKEIESRKRALEINPERDTALLAWKRCMNNFGFEYSKPSDAMDFVSRKLISITSSQQTQILKADILDQMLVLELSVSSKDLKCRALSNLTQVEERVLNN